MYSIDEWEGKDIYNPRNRLNIVMPMAGNGRRLAHLGHKPLVDVAGKPMVRWAVESLGIEGRYIFVVQKWYAKELVPLLKSLKPDCVIVQLDEPTEGAAQTVLAAKAYIDNDWPLITVNCDQYLEWEPDKFLAACRTTGCILTYTMSEKDGSFCVLRDDGYVVRVAEKDVVSDVGTVGVYYFGRGKDFVRYASQMVEKNVRVNGEFYILPVYNELIGAGILPTTYHLSGKRHVWRIGVQRELEEFLDYKRTNP